jgi:hypothetical protein
VAVGFGPGLTVSRAVLRDVVIPWVAVAAPQTGAATELRAETEALLVGG